MYSHYLPEENPGTTINRHHHHHDQSATVNYKVYNLTHEYQPSSFKAGANARTMIDDEGIKDLATKLDAFV